MLHHGIDGVARGARHIAHDRAILADKAIGERAFSRVRTTDDGHVDRIIGLRFFVLDAAQVVDDGIEQIARTVAMHRGDRERVAQAKLVELPNGVFHAWGIKLVHRQQDRRLPALEDARDLHVIGNDAGATVHEKDDHIGLLRAHERLLAD